MENRKEGATATGTERYAARFADRAAEGHFRAPENAGGLTLSSIGVGTYLGETDERTDRGYTEAVSAAVHGGVNVIDTAINYRCQRSERSIGAALQQLAADGFAREELVICTKAGYLTPDNEMPRSREAYRDYFKREYFASGVIQPQDIAAGSHCMTPRYLEDQIARSLRNLGAGCLDVFYLHNPETQLSEVSREEFHARLRAAFAFLEQQAAAGKIRYYGMATWSGFRVDTNAQEHMSLAEVVALAEQVGGSEHRLRFVQLPFNLAMSEALGRTNQKIDGREVPMVQAAEALGVTLVASASLMQGRLARGLPPVVTQALGLESDHLRAIQFARSSPGITTALVGMSRAAHVAENLKLVGVAPARQEQFLRLFERD
ncbi:MAG: aldo/keto reductase [Candidatus Acidiferrales bacterium]